MTERAGGTNQPDVGGESSLQIYTNWARFTACTPDLIDGAEGKAIETRRVIETTCRVCPVRESCLADALENYDYTTVIWGGTTGKERRKLRSKYSWPKTRAFLAEVERKRKVERELVDEEPHIIVEFTQVAKTAKEKAKQLYKSWKLGVKHHDQEQFLELLLPDDTPYSLYTRLLKEIEQGNRAWVPNVDTVAEHFHIISMTFRNRLEAQNLYDSVLHYSYNSVRRRIITSVFLDTLTHCEQTGARFPKIPRLAEVTEYASQEFKPVIVTLLKDEEIKQRYQSIKARDSVKK
jgi:hypothetical protein